MRLRYSPAAARDIQRLYRQSIILFGMRQADAYYDGFAAAIGQLQAFPEAAPLREDLHGAFRVMRYQSHNIVYRIDAGEIVVVRILHGRMDMPRHVKP